MDMEPKSWYTLNVTSILSKPSMTTLINTNQLKTINVDLEQIRRLFTLSTQLADSAEDILESRGEYSDEFVSGLRQSLTDASQGNVKPISSLQELASS